MTGAYSVTRFSTPILAALVLPSGLGLAQQGAGQEDTFLERGEKLLSSLLIMCVMRGAGQASNNALA